MLTQIIQICIIPLLGILTKYLVDFLNAKRDALAVETQNQVELKYKDMILHTVTSCVLATKQTLVDSLKAAGEFTEKSQQDVLKKTLDTVITLLTDEVKNYIKETTGDIETYLTALIEAQIGKTKTK